jgi:hypothetical protein
MPNANTEKGEVGLGLLTSVVKNWRTGKHLGAYGLFADKTEAYLFFESRFCDITSQEKTLHLHRGHMSLEEWEREVDQLRWIASAKQEIQGLLEYVRLLTHINPWNYV